MEKLRCGLSARNMRSLTLAGALSSSHVAHLQSDDGKLLASGSWDSTVKIWSADKGAQLKSLTHESPVLSVAITPDGRALAGVPWMERFRLWDINTGHELRMADGTLRCG